MPNTDPNDPDQQAANLIRYTLIKSGWIIDTLRTTTAGVELVAHRNTQRGTALTRRGFQELVE
jgi:hypothetical protein